MSKDSKCFVCGMLCMLCVSVLVCPLVVYCVGLCTFCDGYVQGKKEGYKEGYTMSLVNQEKGTPHDFILEEKDNGEFVWVANKEGKWE